MRRVALVMIGAAMAVAGLAKAQIYTWKDSNGVTHYTDSPPAQDKGVAVKKLQAPTGNTLPRQEIPKTRDDGGHAQRAAQESSRAEVRRLICEKARADLQAMENSPRRSAARKSGKPGQSGSAGQMGSLGQMGSAGQGSAPSDQQNYALDSEDRSAEEAALRKLMAENCD